MCSAILSPDEFRTALAKGHGRAFQAVRRHGHLIDEDAVLDACRHNRAYDPQLEGSRADWMFEILEAADAVSRLRDPILAELSRAEPASDTWDLDQLCDFAVSYARLGSSIARKHLYRIAEEEPAMGASWMAEDQIVRLDGMAGFLRLAGIRGKAVRVNGTDWDFGELTRAAEEHVGRGQMDETLRDRAASDPDLGAFRHGLMEYWRSIDEIASGSNSRRDRMKAISVQDILDQIGDGKHPSRTVSLLQWGRFAEAEDLNRILNVLFAEDRPDRLFQYVSIFATRALPDFDQRFIGFARHSDPKLRKRAMLALARNRHPAVREFALEILSNGEGDRSGIAFLAMNYQPGDHRLIEGWLRPSTDPDESHALVWDIIDVFRSNPCKESLKSLLFAYEETPCSGCRGRIVALMAELEILPESILEECRFDSNDDIRKLSLDSL